MDIPQALGVEPLSGRRIKLPITVSFVHRSYCLETFSRPSLFFDIVLCFFQVVGKES